MGIFDKKNFNGEVFAKYVEKTPNLARNELIKSRAVRVRGDQAELFRDQVGGNFATVPIYGRIASDTTQNYDGSTDITASSLGTFTQGKVVIGRADAWTEKDFSYDITGGTDFIAQIATQVGEYWDDVDQAILLATLKGVFAMTGASNLEFVNGHTHDISADADAKFDAVTLNNGIQKALGDNKGKFSLAIMHSAKATELENLQVLEYMKYTDGDGIQRSLSIATLNGRTVLVDDGMPVEEVTVDSTTYNKYTTYVFGEGAIELTDCGVKVPYETDRDPAKFGGLDALYSRQRKIFSPYGISWKGNALSPTNTQLESGANWELANSNESAKKYFPHKAIPIARIITQ
jgi:hypothetical protein